jgi:hypothetical protein
MRRTGVAAVKSAGMVTVCVPQLCGHRVLHELETVLDAQFQDRHPDSAAPMASGRYIQAHG